MAPTHVMVIRHAEKPSKDGSVLGVTQDGQPDPNELAVRGWQRAGALARFFLPRSGPPAAPLPVPTRLYAPRPSESSHSQRALHTLGPLAELGELDIDTRFAVDEEPDLAAAIALDHGVVLVAWEHKRIHRIVKHLTAGAIEAPFWPPDRFDVILVIEREPTWYLRQVPQMLLAGDREKPLPDTRGDEREETAE